jgi:ATP-dependent DNA helicase PIF1
VNDWTVLRTYIILTTLNTTVIELNSAILASFPGAERVYESADSTDVDNKESGIAEMPLEYLRSIQLPSLPLSTLRLKVGVPVMCLRNIAPEEGLCNGSRIVITELGRHCLQVRMLGGEFDGEFRAIPRIKISSKDELPFTLTRKQFPIRVCFAMTINKSQGQSFEQVGVDLRTPAFTHGQFYVAVSRVSSATGLHVLLPDTVHTTENIVYPEVLAGLQ